MMRNSHNLTLNSVSLSPNPSPSHTLAAGRVLFCFLFVCCFFTVPNSFSVFVSVSAQCFNENGFPKGTPSSQALVMWVSSTKHTGALGGRSGANALCTSMQPASWTAAGITSEAMLSYSDENLIEALPANVDIKNTIGECIAADRQDLFSGLLLAPLLYDETGEFLPDLNVNVFTATTSEGYKSGLGIDWTGPTAAKFYETIDDPDKYCGDFSSTATVASLGKLSRSSDVNSVWIQKEPDAVAEPCAVENHIYCITTAPAPTSPATTENTVAQDPQFVGLQGQRFQVHGIPEEYFNLVSYPFFQLNSRFTYLATGICNYNDTLCWSHPGTYVDELGLMLPGYEIGIFAGEHQHGITVTVNGRTILHSTSSSSSSSSSSIIDGSFPFNVQFPLRIDNDTINSHHTTWLEPQPQPGSSSSSSSSSGSRAGSGSGLDSGSDVGSNDPSSIGIDANACPSCWLLSSSVSVTFLSRLHVVIDTPVATLDIYNADHFFNFALELRAPRLLLAGAPLDRIPSTHSRSRTHAHVPGAGAGTGGVASAAISPAATPHPTFPMHGLVGQTWKNVKYPHGRLYAGEVDDYMLSDRRLFSTNFVYNEYQY